MPADSLAVARPLAAVRPLDAARLLWRSRSADPARQLRALRARN